MNKQKKSGMNGYGKNIWRCSKGCCCHIAVWRQGKKQGRVVGKREIAERRQETLK